MIRVNFFKDAKCPISEKIVQKIVDISALREKKIFGVVEITVVTPKLIKKLNNDYRGKNSVTDVLSFSWRENDPKEKVLGQIYICYDRIVKQAKEYKISEKEEFVRMLAHGLLHLVGHDHLHEADSKKMFSIQEKIVREANDKKLI